MDKWLILIILLCFLFIITYEPSGKKKGKENYQPVQEIKTCCDDVKYMSENKDQCQAAHFRGVQFVEKNGCPTKTPCTTMGAIINC